MEYDFSGYVTKNDLKCLDGRTIRRNAFKESDALTVPLVWQHGHESPNNVLGHAILENRDDGVYAYCSFNETDAAQHAKTAVKHGDITKLSIYANGLIQSGMDVLHGFIREVSLAISGQNPGAYIDNVVIQHGGSEVMFEDEAIIATGLTIEHADKASAGEPQEDERSLQDIIDTMNDEQKDVVAFLLSQALEEGDVEHADSMNEPPSTENNTDDNLQHSDQEGTLLVRNVFQSQTEAPTSSARPTLTHAQLKTIIDDAQRLGSYRESFLQHAVTYGIENIDYLFPDAKTLANSPELITRRLEWVDSFMAGTRKSPFSRIKSMSADLTLDTARAKGYVKANMKKEEFFALSKRVTTPTTVYKKQKLDRDDIIDITDLDVVAWLKAEMQLMIKEEIARASLIGDGREIDDDDKINETNIRPIAQDDDFYAHRVQVAANVSGDVLIETILRARPSYRGSGNPMMFTTESVLTDLILLKDKMGRRLYPTQAELESALRVSKIVTVDVMEGATTTQGEILAILVNLGDYTHGADRGGALSMFDDFDIDFNQYKYLIETRLSGCLTKYKSAIVVTRTAGTLVTPTVPTFVPATGVVTIPSVTGVIYRNAETEAVLTAGAQTAIAAGATVSIEAVPDTGYYFPHNFDADWDFTRDA